METEQEIWEFVQVARELERFWSWGFRSDRRYVRKTRKCHDPIIGRVSNRDTDPSTVQKSSVDKEPEKEDLEMDTGDTPPEVGIDFEVTQL